MAVTLESAGTVSVEPLPHPSGLQVGDLMIACCLGRNSNAITATGWTSQEGLTVAGDTSRRAEALYKVADADDVSNGQTSFGQSGGQVEAGVILRTTGGDTANLVSASATNGADASTFTETASVTPATVDSLMIMFWGSRLNSGAISASGYAIATNDPSWTERADAQVTSAGNGVFGIHVATATRAETTASGDSSITYSGTVEQTAVILMSLGLPSNVSVTGDTGIINVVGNEGEVAANADVSGTTRTINVVGNEGTVVTSDSKVNNKDKNAASNVTNKDKS